MSGRIRVFIEKDNDCPLITTDSEAVVNIVSLYKEFSWMDWLYPSISAVDLDELDMVVELVANVAMSLEIIEVDVADCPSGQIIWHLFRNRIGTIINQGEPDI